MLVLLAYSLFDNSKSLKNLRSLQTNVVEINNLPIVVLIFDEMSGINSYESKTPEGKNLINISLI